MRISRALLVAVLAGGSLAGCGGDEPFDVDILCYALKKEQIAEQAGVEIRTAGPTAVLEENPVHQCSWAAKESTVETEYVVELSIAANPRSLRLPRSYEDREELPELGTDGYRGFDETRSLESVNTTANGWTMSLTCEHSKAKFEEEGCTDLAKLVVRRMPKREEGQTARF
ncbi:hypothetical protein ACWKSP_38115 [Micromonosporaceae bacterium Da 78-11]